MQKFWSKTLIGFLMLSIFLAPVSAGIKTTLENKLALNVEINEAEATHITPYNFTGTVTAGNITSGSAVITAVLKSNTAGSYFNYVDGHSYLLGAASLSGFEVQLSDDPNFANNTANSNPAWATLGYGNAVFPVGTLTIGSISDVAGFEIPLSITFGSLELGKTYYARLTMENNSGDKISISNVATFTTSEDASDTPDDSSNFTNGNNDYLDCGVRNLMGCLANIFYGIWEISAWVARGAGQFLDFFIAYAIDSGSYKNDFVEKGWGAIRDVANVFFIVALLYVGLKTILGMNVSNNKRLVGMIILIALVINFSLFTTKVVIDASNVLARIFYNNISPVNENGVPISPDDPDATKNKSITVGMVREFNPHTIVNNAKTNGNVGEYIFITIASIIVTGYMIYIFVSVALLFLARVVSLWIAMIFSPIAFASLTIEADMGGLGFKKWWSELLKVAFLAPIFIFFLYIIVLFLHVLGTGTTNFKSDNTTIQNLMGVFIPFAILMVLLMKAKKLAVEYSGEMGEMITKAGAAVGGLALGAATGGVAMAGRATLGRAGGAIANSEWAKKREAEGKFGGKMTRDFGKFLGKGSMDIKGIKIAGKDLSSTGLKGLDTFGKAKEGGFTQIRADKTEKRIKRAEELKVGPDEESTKQLREKEITHQTLLKKEITDSEGKKMTAAQKIDQIDKRKAIAQQNVIDTAAAVRQDPENDAKKAEAKEATEAVTKLKKERKAIKNGEVYTYTNVDGTIDTADYRNINVDNGSITKKELLDAEKKAKNLKGEETNARTKEATVIANEAKAKAEETTAVADEATAVATRKAAHLAFRLDPTNTSLENAFLTAESAEKKASEVAAKATKAAADATAEVITAKATATVASANAATAAADFVTTKGKVKVDKKTGKQVFNASINDYEDDIIPEARNKVETIGKERAQNYAEQVGSSSNKFWNYLGSGGQHSARGADEAKHKILMGAKIETK